MASRFGSFAFGAFISALALVDCGGSQPMMASTSVSAARIDPTNRSQGCHGQNHVHVSPCPVELYGTSGIDITIEGPGVSDSRLQRCAYDYCHLLKIDGTHWQVWPGTDCGTARIIGWAYNAKGREIADFSMDVTNHCS